MRKRAIVACDEALNDLAHAEALKSIPLKEQIEKLTDGSDVHMPSMFAALYAQYCWREGMTRKQTAESIVHMILGSKRKFSGEL